MKGNTKSDKAPKKNSFVAIDKFAQIKENYRTFKLPQNWTAGISSGRLVFNRIKVTTFKSQQKISVERSLIITKDCNTHVLINGSEIILTSWALQKVDNIDDVKRAVRDIDSLKICEGPTNGQKSPQCFIFLDNQHKTCPACKSEVTNPQKQEKSVPASKKPKPSKPKTVSKKNSVQKEKSDRTGLISENGLMSK